jgi:DNA polymerase type B, organellar and viral
MPPRRIVQIRRSLIKQVRFRKKGSAQQSQYYRISITDPGLTMARAEQIATRDSVNKAAAGLRGEIFVSYMLPTGEWRSSKGGIAIGQPVTLYHPDEYDEAPEDNWKIKEMAVIIVPPGRGGVDDVHNDCLYNAVMLCLGDYKNKVKISATEFKQKLGVDREDTIPMDRLYDVEQLLNIKINCYGETVFRTKNQNKGAHRQIVNIQIVDDHVTPYRYDAELQKRKRQQLTPDYNFKERDILLRRKVRGMIEFYNGIELEALTYREFSERFYGKKDYTIVEVDCEDLKEAYEQILKDYDTLKKATSGRINLKKGQTISSHILKKFYFNSYGTAVPDPIEADEFEFIKNIGGGIMMSKPGKYKSVYEYDINSWYPHLMVHMQFPMHKGKIEFVSLSNLLADDVVRYGIYNVNVDTSGQYYLRRDRDNMYTHFDIMMAKRLGLKIESIDGSDEVHACLYPPETRESGQRLFQQTIEEFYSLKLRKLPYVKNMLNSLWGALCEKSAKSIYFKLEDGFDLPSGAHIERIHPVNIEKDEFCVRYKKLGQFFKTDYARIGKFLTSNGRYKLFETMRPHVDSIVRVHTDGFISTKLIPELDKQKNNRAHGKFKRDDFSGIEIHHVNKITCLDCGRHIKLCECR